MKKVQVSGLRFQVLWVLGLALWTGAGWAQTDLNLARELSREGDHYGAAIELRRAAMQDGAVPDLWWGAAWESWQDGHPQVAEHLIDDAEDGGFDSTRASLLPAGAARS